MEMRYHLTNKRLMIFQEAPATPAGKRHLEGVRAINKDGRWRGCRITKVIQAMPSKIELYRTYKITSIAVGVTRAAFGRPATKRTTRTTNKTTKRRKPVAKKRRAKRKGSLKHKKSNIKTPIDRIPVGKVRAWP